MTIIEGNTRINLSSILIKITLSTKAIISCQNILHLIYSTVSLLQKTK
jgi:hypothetical protein